MHFEATGKILDIDGTVFVKIYTNYDLLNAPPPEELFEVFSPRTLVQGRQNAFDQFRFDYGSLADGSASICFATFRQSYGLLTVAITPERADLCPSLTENAKAYKPGAFNLN